MLGVLAQSHPELTWTVLVTWGGLWLRKLKANVHRGKWLRMVKRLHKLVVKLSLPEGTGV